MKWLGEQDGNAWKYAMKYRPASAGFTCPKDGYLCRLDSSPEAKCDGYPHGAVYYERPLSPEEVESFELVPLGTV